MLSPDGETLYVADAGGRIFVIDVDSGEQLARYDVGSSLGGLSISADGKYLSATEQVEVGTGTNAFDEQVPVVYTYRIDAATGETETYELVTGFYDYTFADSAFLTDGSIVLTQNFQGSGWTDLRILDPETGEFTSTGTQVRHGSPISVSDDFSTLLIGEADISNAPLLLYDLTGSEPLVLTAQTDAYNFGQSGFNFGVQALSADGSMAAQWLYYSGLFIFDDALGLEVNVFDTVPSLLDDTLTGLAFSQDGSALYVLSATANAVVQVSTQNWQETARFNLPEDANFDFGSPYGRYGNNLLTTDDGEWLIVVADDAVLRLDPNRLDGTSAADLLRAGPGGMDLYGYEGADLLLGGAGNDTLIGGPGSDRLLGGDGIDTAIYSGNRADYSVAYSANGEGLIITDLRPEGSDGRDYVRDVENIEFADGPLASDSITAAASFSAELITSTGFVGLVGDRTAVFGTAGFERIAVFDAPGLVTFDPSFSVGGDTIALPESAAAWTVEISGSNALFAKGALEVLVPIGVNGTAISFQDGVRTLVFDQDENAAFIGTMEIGQTPARVTSPSEVNELPLGYDETISARLLLQPGAEVPIAGTVEIFGTFAQERVELIGQGNYTFDPSFNLGGDVVVFPDTANSYVASQSGSAFLIESMELSVTLPAGLLPTTLAFDRAEAPAYFDQEQNALFIGPMQIGPDPIALNMIG